MAEPFVRVLIRVISLRGRQAVESVLLGEFTTVENQGGGKLVSTSIGGKSFTFQVPSGLNTDQLMVACDEALRLWDSMDATQRKLYLTVRPQRTVVARF